MMDAGLRARLADVRGVVFDIDGCLILSDQPAGHDGLVLPGAVAAVHDVRASGRRVLAFTNASSRPPAEIAASLNELGFAFGDGEVLTPSVVAAQVVLDRYGDAPVLAFGGDGLVAVLREAGVRLADPDQPGEVAAVVVGWDVAFDQAKLQSAAEAIWHGAPLLVTSDAPAFATRGRRTAGAAGFIANGLAHVTGASYEVVGKPSAVALRTAARLLDVAPEAMLVAGDDLTLEVAMARRGGGVGVLVTTGMHTERDARQAPEEQRPDLVVGGLAELVESLLEADSARTTAGAG
ncbi:MAG TPA: HAD hydrolase-like protein [Actinomycetes bacterium]|nr:HAD hydrolase-like protein [Actinomycetes bacterium]